MVQTAKVKPSKKTKPKTARLKPQPIEQPASSETVDLSAPPHADVFGAPAEQLSKVFTPDQVEKLVELDQVVAGVTRDELEAAARILGHQDACAFVDALDDERRGHLAMTAIALRAEPPPDDPIEAAVAPLRARLTVLEAELASLRGQIDRRVFADGAPAALPANA